MIRVKYILGFVIGLAVCAGLGGCMMGPDYVRPRTVADEGGCGFVPSEKLAREEGVQGYRSVIELL